MPGAVLQEAEVAGVLLHLQKVVCPLVRQVREAQGGLDVLAPGLLHFEIAEVELRQNILPRDLMLWFLEGHQRV